MSAPTAAAAAADCSILKEVVDELLAEVASEAAAVAAAADAFSFDMLVAAVAFSQGKYDLGFNVGAGQGSAAAAAGAASGYIGQSKPGGVAREAALLQKAAERETALKEDAQSAGISAGNRLVIKAGDAAADIAEEDVYIAKRDFTAADHAFAEGMIDPSSAAEPGSTRGRGRQQQQAKVSARGLYLAGLRGMLWEMRSRRPPDTPYGHTQPLAPHFTQGSATSKVSMGCNAVHTHRIAWPAWFSSVADYRSLSVLVWFLLLQMTTMTVGLRASK